MSLISRNLDLGPPLKISSWRKVAIGTWRTAGDPSVYGTLELDAAPALDYIDALKRKTGVKITMTHFIGKVLAETLDKHPAINCVLRMGRLYPRKSVDLFFQVASDNTGKDLSGTTIREANRKSIQEIAQEMHEKVQDIRLKGDPSFKKMKNTMGLIPGCLISSVLKLVGFFMYTLNLWSPLLGSPRDPFGSIMITNVGALGMDAGFAPLVPYSRVPILIAVGAVKDTPVVRNGQVEVAQMCRLFVTFDHRLIDGMHASHMVKTLQNCFLNPEKEFATLERV